MISIYTAFILDSIFGDPYWFPHPVRLIGKYISSFERMIRKITNKSTELRIAGILLTVTTVFLTYGSSYLLLKLIKDINILIYHALNILLLYTCIAARCLAFEGHKIFIALRNNDIEFSRKLLSYIVGRDTEKLNESEITRATVETVSENTSDGIIAPIFYMFIGGAPLALAYKAINTLDSMVGYKSEKYIDFGWASAKLDDISNFIPARITAILICISAFIIRMDGKSSYQIFIRDRKNHTSPNSGCPEAAAAGALGVQLGGTNMYFGKEVSKPTIGDFKRPLVKEDIKRMTKLMYVAVIIGIITFSFIKYVWEILI